MLKSDFGNCHCEALAVAIQEVVSLNFGFSQSAFWIASLHSQ